MGSGTGGVEKPLTAAVRDQRRSFIYSLPRSGSAWLSLFLTGRDSFCFHEPTAEIDVGMLFSSRPEPVVCGVDTGAYLVAPDIGRVLGARCFVLRRDIADIQKSLQQAGFSSVDAKIEAVKFDKVTAGMAVIEYHRLPDAAYQREIWEAVIGLKFDAVRAAAISGMNIQRDVGLFLEGIST
jgi:hypothetical protein